jgi:hypothetical protein
MIFKSLLCSLFIGEPRKNLSVPVLEGEPSTNGDADFTKKKSKLPLDGTESTNETAELRTVIQERTRVKGTRKTSTSDVPL